SPAKDADPNSDTVTLEVARRMLARNEVETAFALLQDLVNAETPLWEPYFQIARIAAAQGERSIAEEFLVNACERENRAGMAHRELAALYLDAGRNEEALERLSPVLRAQAQNHEALELLRRILGHCGELGPVPWARLITDLRHSP